MEILSSRQASFDCAEIHEIKRVDAIDVSNFNSIKDCLIESLSEKYGDAFIPTPILVDCVEQTVHILKGKGSKFKPVNSITLWKKYIQMTPELEALGVGISTMLIKHHYPEMAKQISKGRIYSHMALTSVREIVLYTLEYFYKKGLIE